MDANRQNTQAGKYLYAIAAGERISEQDAERELERAGIRTSEPARLIALDFGYHEDETVLNAFSAIRLSNEFADAVMCLYQQIVLILVIDAVARSETFTKALSAYLLKRSCKAGRSDAITGISNYRYACKQALIALEYGQFDGETRLVDFSESYVQYLAACKNPDTELVKYCLHSSIVKQIENDDIRNHTNRIDVLRAYLENGCRSTKAAYILNTDNTLLESEIRNLQISYGFDLSGSVTRERMRAELRFLGNRSNT